MTFTRPGFSTIEVTDEQIQEAATGELRELYEKTLDRLNKPSAELNVAHRIADRQWEKEAEEKAAALEITAAEYSRRARRGLVAQELEKNANRYAATATTPFQQACAASLYRQAAKAAPQLVSCVHPVKSMRGGQ